MIRHLLLVAVLFGIAGTAQAERVWLVIGASARSPALIAAQAKTLAHLSTNGLVVRMSDCGQNKNVFAWVAAVTTSPETAKSALARLRESIGDAYVKRCDVKPRSLLAFRFTAVDASIADVPRDAVNWEDQDRISTIHPLPNGAAVVIVRHFVNDKEDPLEGRRERVVLAKPSGQRVTLEEECFHPGHISEKNGKVSFDCATEQAGENMLHTVVVSDGKGEKLADIEHCRNPRWSDSQAIVCDSESVGPDGVLRLHPRHVEVGNRHGNPPEK